MSEIKSKRVLVFGYLGYITNQLDGQTVKTRAIFDLLKERAVAETRYADSQEFRYNGFSIFRFFKNLVQCNTLIWLPAHNNLKYLFPIIWYTSKVFHFRIVYIVVGGWLSTILQTLPWHRKRLKKIDGILVENRLTMDELRNQYGYHNIDVIPNFREDTPKPCFRKYDGVLKLVFMARINKMKGLDTIANICDNLPDNVTIDFYGPINKDDEPFFYSQLVDKYSFISYNGEIDPHDINDVLQNYDAMLLPTKYYTEGLPGSIIDAYQAGIPVVVTRWKHAVEFVENGKSGYIVDFRDPEDELINVINKLASCSATLEKMKDFAYTESHKYTKTTAWNILKNYI